MGRNKNSTNKQLKYIVYDKELNIEYHVSTMKKIFELTGIEEKYSFRIVSGFYDNGHTLKNKPTLELLKRYSISKRIDNVCHICSGKIIKPVMVDKEVQTDSTQVEEH